QVLHANKLQAHGLRRESFVGHPEGHPYVPLAEIRRAEIDKANYARDAGRTATIVTHFWCEAAPFVEWSRELGSPGAQAELAAGLAGPASVATLFKLAMRCGIGRSIRALGARPGVVGQLIGERDPKALLVELASARDVGSAPLDGVHLF